MPVNPNPDPNPYPIQAMPDWRRFFVVFFFCAATGDGVSLELALNDNDGDVADDGDVAADDGDDGDEAVLRWCRDDGRRAARVGRLAAGERRQELGGVTWARFTPRLLVRCFFCLWCGRRAPGELVAEVLRGEAVER